jgi:hypothetical protein
MSKQQIIMVGNSRGAQDGDRRTVDAKRAEDLVRAGLAKYPPTSKAAAEKSAS